MSSPSTTAAFASCAWREQRYYQSYPAQMPEQQSLQPHEKFPACVIRSRLWQIWIALDQSLWNVRTKVEGWNGNPPIENVGDSTAALNISNGTRAYIWSKASRPLEIVIESCWVLVTSKTSGSVTTRKWNTSSLNFWAYCPKTDVEGIPGDVEPSVEEGGLSMNSNQRLIVSTDMDCLQAV